MQRLFQGGNEQRHHRHLVAGQDDHSQLFAGEILLVREVLIRRDQNLKLAFSQVEEFAVFYAHPANFLHGLYA